MNPLMRPLEPFGVIIEAQGAPSNVEDLDLSVLREYFAKEHFILLRGFRALESAEDFSNYCERFGEISLWPFGKVLELLEQSNPEDHIFDNNYVPLHWDGMYRPQVPEYQIFQCVKAPLKGQGGRTTFSNTALTLQNALPETIKLWSKVSGSYQRKMEFYDSKVAAPILTQHPTSGASVIRYNEPPRVELRPFLNPPILGFSGVSEQELETFHATLRDALYHPANFYAHEWQNGDLVIADNHTLLHGREAFVTKAPRHLRRVHVLGDTARDNPHLVSHK